jgi:very-short-patch-repair endonuclease
MYFIPYNRSLKEFSRELRNHSTLSEILLWEKLRASQFRSYGFNRQKPLNHYIVDFYCKKLNLVIEIDGASHDDEFAAVNDQDRQSILQGLGLLFLRFSDLEVKKNMPSVLGELNNFIDDFEERNGLDKTFFV